MHNVHSVLPTKLLVVELAWVAEEFGGVFAKCAMGDFLSLGRCFPLLVDR